MCQRDLPEQYSWFVCVGRVIEAVVDNWLCGNKVRRKGPSSRISRYRTKIEMDEEW